jgi:ferredoxin, 2Fe-2S
MPKIFYVLPDGARRPVDVAVGQSVMLGAIQNNVPGIDAECGGCLSCATCHVYVDEADMARVPEMDPSEDDLLLGVAAERRPTSRLACQIIVKPDLDGLTIHIPTTQL